MAEVFGPQVWKIKRFGMTNPARSKLHPSLSFRVAVCEAPVRGWVQWERDAPERLSVRTTLLAAAAALMVSACEAEPEVRYDLVLDDIVILDTRDGGLSPGRALAIQDGEIVRIAEAGALVGDTMIDGAGRYAIPGLWDSHVHATSNVEETLQRNFPLFLAHGVTQVRDMGTNIDRLTAVRAALAAEGAPAAPHLISGGPLLIIAELPWYGDIQLPVPDAAAAPDAVASLDAAGVDLLKAYSGLPEDSYRAIIAEAEARGLPVDGHVPDSIGFEGVIEAGQRTIEHLDLSALLSCAADPEGRYAGHINVQFGEGMAAYYALMADFYADLDWTRCGAALERHAEAGGAYTPTLVMELRDRSRVDPEAFTYMSEGGRDWCETNLAQIDDVPEADRERAYEAVEAALRELRDRGVTLLAGTDNPNYCLVPGVSLSWEFEAMEAAGLTRLHVLQSATLNPARIFQTGHPGYLAETAPADIVLLDANPLEGLETLRAPAGVMRSGEWFDAEALAGLRAQAAAFYAPAVDEDAP